MKRSIDIISTASLPAECLLQLQQHGFTTEVIPFIKTYSSVSAANIQRIRSLEKYMATAIFTSAHGVEAVAECLFHLPAWKIACINGKTKKTVEHYFDEQDIIATAPNAAALIKELDGKVQEPVLFFCGNLRLDTIPNWLKDTGTPFEEIQVYKTEFTPHDIQNKKPAAVLFFSTSTVESFFTINTLPAETLCFAIGETTAAALKQKISNEVIVSVQPDKTALTELVIKHYHEHS